MNYISNFNLLFKQDEEKDGLIYVREGVPKLSIGNQFTASVVIFLDKSHYIRGVAVSSCDIPDGVDIVYNFAEGMPVIKDVDVELLDKIYNEPGSYIYKKRLADEVLYQNSQK